MTKSIEDIDRDYIADVKYPSPTDDAPDEPRAKTLDLGIDDLREILHEAVCPTDVKSIRREIAFMKRRFALVAYNEPCSRDPKSWLCGGHLRGPAN